MTTKIVTRRPSGNWTGNEIDRMFERFFGEMMPAETRPSGSVWSPSVDVKEDEQQFTVLVELPGLKSSEIEVQVENNVLFISGERRMEEKKEGENWHFVERSYGSFSRSFRLPKNVDSEAVKASYTDGMLSISIPKAEEARPRKVEIS
ncbi:Hsp20/alpha crystallin family protein [bacterium]|nr:Hsp20/alpha crystallin family protein [bacterium]UNM07224.1 MAG: Hsp20/alpha crystallin family protein [Planctomycetales bacterium]